MICRDGWSDWISALTSSVRSQYLKLCPPFLEKVMLKLTKLKMHKLFRVMSMQANRRSGRLCAVASRSDGERREPEHFVWPDLELRIK
mmetsp:Transcript_14721/g.39435  ORF Transcript_14721/g.39435 Transcript_14721/m.39435 type:complete len:88 (-) Transcript_14721:638-901(-)